MDGLLLYFMRHKKVTQALKNDDIGNAYISGLPDTVIKNYKIFPDSFNVLFKN
jgi:hypothetical protein